MMRKLVLATALALTFSFNAHSSPGEYTATQLLFEEEEPGVEPYLTRILITRRYLRIDDGVEHSDFVLFDRVLGNVHNINHEERQEVILQRRPPLDIAPAELDFSIERRILSDAPKIDGITGVEHRFVANGVVCQRSINFKGLLPEAVDALRRYREVVIRQTMESLGDVPESLQTPCYLAKNAYHANSVLEQGFPVMQIDDQGQRRQLLEFSSIQVPAALFRLPTDYDEFYL